MTLSIHRPSHFCSEWVLAGSVPPTQLFEKLQAAGFQEIKNGLFIQKYEGATFSIQRQAKYPYSSDRFFLFYARFDGNPEFGKIIVEYICELMELEMRALEVFVPGDGISQLKKIKELGFHSKSLTTSGLAQMFINQGIALILFKEGYILQIRSSQIKNWHRLHTRIFSILDQLQVYKKTGIEKAM